MERLTLEELELLNIASAYNGTQHKEICGRATLELIEYKKIEEELGIDLITLFKALKNGVYYITKTKGLRKEYATCLTTEYMGSKKLLIKLKIKGTPHLYFKDYGKTWALTREELL